MAATDLAFDDGDRVLAMGRLVRDGGDWWLDSRRVMTLASRASGGRSELSTRLVAADAHVRALQKQDPAAARLWAHVIGVWRRGAITVEAVGAGPGRPDRPVPGPDVHRDPTPHEQAELDDVAATLGSRSLDWGLESWNAQAQDETGRPYVFVELFRVTHGVADWADSRTDGLVVVDPSVRRHRR